MCVLHAFCYKTTSISSGVRTDGGFVWKLRVFYRKAPRSETKAKVCVCVCLFVRACVFRAGSQRKLALVSALPASMASRPRIDRISAREFILTEKNTHTITKNSSDAHITNVQHTLLASTATEVMLHNFECAHVRRGTHDARLH